MARVYLALGANVGNRMENLRMALRLLGEYARIIEVSSPSPPSRPTSSRSTCCTP
jgi:7,8-dihydro-6-hydroxymethylpterin-pyrophosphokinase